MVAPESLQRILHERLSCLNLSLDCSLQDTALLAGMTLDTLRILRLSPYALAAGFNRKVTPIRLNAFIAAIVAVKSTKSLSLKTAEALA